MNRTQERTACFARLHAAFENAQVRGLLTGLVTVGGYALAQYLFPYTRLLWAFAAVLAHFAATRGHQIGTWAEELETRLKRASPRTPAPRSALLLLNLTTRLLLSHALIETVGMPWRGFLLAAIIGQTLLAACETRAAASRESPHPFRTNLLAFLPLCLASLLLLCVLLACIGLAALPWLGAALLLGFLLKRLAPNAPAVYAFWAENAEILALLLLATRAAGHLL